jgi:hypothetical protein
MDEIDSDSGVLQQFPANSLKIKLNLAQKKTRCQFFSASGLCF